MKLSDMSTAEEVHQEDLLDPAYRQEWERTALARAVAVGLLKYRAEHHLSQRALAAQLGWRQPQVARLERGDSTPGVDTLIHLARVLKMHFLVAIGDVHVETQPGDIVETGDQLLAAAGA